jgi:hypothetical protein
MSSGRFRQALRRARRVFWRRPAVLRFDLGERAQRSPPHKWTARRRVMVCTAAAAGSFALVTYVWRVLDAGSRAAEAAGVEALEQRLRESRAKIERLPQLRDLARTHPSGGRAQPRSANGDWHAVADLASRAGVTLHALLPAAAAPGARGRNGQAGRKGLHVDGRADFPALYAFLGGLSTLPMLVVPEDLEIKPENGALALNATLEVFHIGGGRAASVANAQAHAPAAADTTDTSIASVGSAAPDASGASGALANPLLANPFDGGAGGATASGSPGRLIGIMQDRQGALALFEAASGLQAIAAVRGQTLGQERLVAIDAAGITLAHARAARRIVFSEGER